MGDGKDVRRIAWLDAAAVKQPDLRAIRDLARGGAVLDPGVAARM